MKELIILILLFSACSTKKVTRAKNTFYLGTLSKYSIKGRRIFFIDKEFLESELGVIMKPNQLLGCFRTPNIRVDQRKFSKNKNSLLNLEYVHKLKEIEECGIFLGAVETLQNIEDPNGHATFRKNYYREGFNVRTNDLIKWLRTRKKI